MTQDVHFFTFLSFFERRLLMIMLKDAERRAPSPDEAAIYAALRAALDDLKLRQPHT